VEINKYRRWWSWTFLAKIIDNIWTSL